MSGKTLGWILAAAGLVAAGTAAMLAGVPRGEHALRAVGPRIISNQTSQPLAIYGQGLRAGDQLTLIDADGKRTQLRLTVVDPGHAYARIAAEALKLPPSVSQAELKASLDDAAPAASLTVVNDAEFVDLTSLALSHDGRWLFAASSTTDSVYAVNLESKAVQMLPAGDGPSALAVWADPAGREWLVVPHRFAPEVWLLSVDGPGRERRVLPGPAMAAGVLVDPQGGVAFIAEQARDTVAALSLPDGSQRWRADVAPNPAAMALFAGRLWVGSLEGGVVDALDPRTGARRARATPDTRTAIIGGHTEAFAKYVMGGRAPRALVGSEQVGRLFVASTGPNTGPNPERMEVAMNGGVGVVTPEAAFLHHLGFNNGVPQALALDEAGGRLYVADIGVGKVRALDVHKLAAGEPDARQALVGEVPIAPPSGFPIVRPAADFGARDRAGVEMHSGPAALALSPDRKTLYALDRFTGTVAVIDTGRISEGAAALREQIPVAPTLGQRTRRLGQILYFTDLGHSAMSCDTCHLEGHGEGVLFEKTHPMRIYRSTTVRGARETPPYFTPATKHSIAETVRDVGDRNRYHNPDLTQEELAALTTFTAEVATLPNPFVGADGAPPESLTLLDGKAGNPRHGLALFEGAAGCAGCHPAPLFTTDQDPVTRGRYLDVGTPKLFPLRTKWQELHFVGAAVPSLLGAWDIFPMLTTGAAGFGLEGEELTISNRFALREVVEKYSGPAHGHADLLGPRDRDDLLAYLLTL
jgi:sugar lactone lactonase YvrE